VGFVHGMFKRTAGLLTQTHDRIRTLITLAYAVCCDETPLRVGPRKPKPGKKKAERAPAAAYPSRDIFMLDGYALGIVIFRESASFPYELALQEARNAPGSASARCAPS